MSENNDFDPGEWSGGGHSFDTAYKDYDRHAGRSFKDAADAGKTINDLLPASLTTNSDAPLIIVTDETGSMLEWPKVMFSKLPYLEIEGQEYLGKGMEICWAAHGDANYRELYPVQARPFTKGTALKDRLMEIVIEKGGGAGGEESSELIALYLARNVETPKAIRKPIVIFIGDERPYRRITPAMAKKYAHVTLQADISTQDVFAELREKFSVYIIRKPYEEVVGDRLHATDIESNRIWAELVGGTDRVAFLPAPERVVDVIFGILAKEVGRVEYFREELEQRQLPDKGGKAKVATVYRALDTVHKLPGPRGSGSGSTTSHSKTKGVGGGKATKPLA